MRQRGNAFLPEHVNTPTKEYAAPHNATCINFIFMNRIMYFYGTLLFLSFLSLLLKKRSPTRIIYESRTFVHGKLRVNKNPDRTTF